MCIYSLSVLQSAVGESDIIILLRFYILRSRIFSTGSIVVQLPVNQTVFF